jgi:hypothetical protein
VKHGIKNICVHKGLFPSSIEERFPHLCATATCAMSARRPRTGRSSTSSSIISAYRYPGGAPPSGLAGVRAHGRISWTSDLADIPQKFGVSNVYGDVGQLFAQSVVAEPRLGAALMGY